ncbi:hypothetical protein OG735_01355 [Streptomyces sp. NBC_01210]|nr:hypothetical protein OG735_01355 [Streptomyces sp. NBC_01210]
MSAPLAMVIFSWIAIVILYLALAAVLREVRMLRRQVMLAPRPRRRRPS